MIATFAVIATSIALGWPITSVLSSARTRSARVAEAFLTGVGVIAVVLATLSLLGLSWQTSFLVVSSCGAAYLLLTFALRRYRGGDVPQRDDDSRRDALTLLCHAGTGVTILGYALFATSASPFEYDFVGMWGLKARVFYRLGAIDLNFLRDSTFVMTHPDYPLLLPLLFDAVAAFAGRWEERWFGLLYVAFGAATLAIANEHMIAALRSRRLAAAATLALAPLALVPWIGLAEAPLIAYSTAALLYMRRALRTDASRDIVAAAVFIGLAASTKNEGVALAVAVVLALSCTAGMRRSWRLWPAVAIVAPWMIARAVLGLGTDLAAGGVLSRVAARIQAPGEILGLIARYGGGRTILVAILVVALIVSARAIWRSERFLLLTLLIQFAFVIGAYVSTPHDLSWHFKWSWERVVYQQLFAVALLTLFGAAAKYGKERTGHEPSGSNAEC